MSVQPFRPLPALESQEELHQENVTCRLMKVIVCLHVLCNTGGLTLICNISWKNSNVSDRSFLWETPFYFYQIFFFLKRRRDVSCSRNVTFRTCIQPNGLFNESQNGKHVLGVPLSLALLLCCVRQSIERTSRHVNAVALRLIGVWQVGRQTGWHLCSGSVNVLDYCCFVEQNVTKSVRCVGF